MEPECYQQIDPVAKDESTGISPRDAERAKYIHVYANDAKYVVSKDRFAETKKDLEAVPCRGSLLEVGCGPGLLLDLAESLGFGPVKGIETVPQCCDGERIINGYAHALPFEEDSFDVACMFDVIEHLLPGDDERACRELYSVARKHILISASNRKSVHCGWDLHVNKRDYGEWHRLFQKWMPGKLTQMPGHHRSPMWRVDL
jgi:SAM-dependent methyltransferase